MFEIIRKLNDFIWGAPMIAMLLAGGFYLSCKIGFFQITHLKAALSFAFGADSKEKAKGGMTPFQSACTALCATMGTGNIAGVAGAVALGGPGAVFWMWVSAFFGMAVKLCEIVLAVEFRENRGGEYSGGPMYYIKNALPRAFFPLAIIFAVCGLAAAAGTGSTVQINTMASAIIGMLGAPEGNFRIIIGAAVGIVCAAAVLWVLLGGEKKIGSVTERLVPFMTILYFAMCIGVIAVNIENLGGIFLSIFKGAFNPAAVTGGAIGSAFIAFKRGLSRGIFSNEAGMGTAPMAYACVSDAQPVKQGMLGIFEVFADTVVMCTLTAVTLLSVGNISFGSDAGAALTLSTFTSVYGGWISVAFCAVVCFFAFSSVVGWGLYGIKLTEFLFKGGKKIFLAVFFFCCAVGGVISADAVWQLSELLNGFMALPNLVAVLLLSDCAAGQIQKYRDKEKINKK